MAGGEGETERERRRGRVEAAGLRTEWDEGEGIGSAEVTMAGRGNAELMGGIVSHPSPVGDGIAGQFVPKEGPSAILPFRPPPSFATIIPHP